MGSAIGRTKAWLFLLEKAYGSRANFILSITAILWTVFWPIYLIHSASPYRVVWCGFCIFLTASGFLGFAGKLVLAGALAEHLRGDPITASRDGVYRNLQISNQALWFLFFAVAAISALYGIRHAPSMSARIWNVIISVILLCTLIKQARDILETFSQRKLNSVTLMGYLGFLSKCLEIFGLIFSPKFREQVYNPVIEEQKADLIVQLEKYHSSIGRCIVVLCFLIRLLIYIFQLVGISRFAKIIAWTLPYIVKAKRD